MSTPAFLEIDALEEEEGNAELDSDARTPEVSNPLVTRRRVEDLLEQKRLERELLEFDLREDYGVTREWEEE